jgi:hypothetical protein
VISGWYIHEGEAVQRNAGAAVCPHSGFVW